MSSVVADDLRKVVNSEIMQGLLSYVEEDSLYPTSLESQGRV